MLDTQSAGRFFKRAQNTHLTKPHLQTAWTIPQIVDSVSRDAANVQTRPQPVLQTVPGLPQQLFDFKGISIETSAFLRDNVINL